jgi:hypothetical protein
VSAAQRGAVNLKFKQLYLNRVEDDALDDEEISLSEPQAPAGPARFDLLKALVVLVLVAIILWLLIIGPMVNPCVGVSEGGTIQDPDHPDRVLVCKD